MFLARRSLRSADIKIDAAACIACQWRSFSTSYRSLAEKPNPTPAPTPAPATPTALDDAPRAYGKAVTEFTPKALNRPIGLPNPPQPGENSGIDKRTLKQRRDDFVDYDKHLVRRKQLTKKISTPYFREWSNMRLHKGKSFLAPPKLFRADRALYFPNLHGETLLKQKQLQDTTNVLKDKVSIVSVFSSAWAENQAATFASEKNNPELHKAVKESDGTAQFIQINMEDNSLKYMLIRLFIPGLRKKYGIDNWKRYFVIRKVLSDDIKDAIGLLNSKVGYTYLLDENCRIRWAASGLAEEGEKEGLVRGVRRLVDDLKSEGKLGAIRRELASLKAEAPVKAKTVAKTTV